MDILQTDVFSGKQKWSSQVKFHCLTPGFLMLWAEEEFRKLLHAVWSLKFGCLISGISMASCNYRKLQNCTRENLEGVWVRKKSGKSPKTKLIPYTRAQKSWTAAAPQKLQLKTAKLPALSQLRPTVKRVEAPFPARHWSITHMWFGTSQFRCISV